MATIAIYDDRLHVTLTRGEKFGGLLKDLSVPVSSITAVEVVPDGYRAAKGMRAPGLGAPKRLIGTWRSKGAKQYVSVRRGQPAVTVALQGERFQSLLIGLDDAAEVSARIEAATLADDAS